jgi:hypothetical protein
MNMAKPSKEVAVKGNQELAVQTEMPDFLKGQMQDCRGSEEVEAGDLVIPRVELVQDLSKARKKADPAYIEGAEEGMLYNNVTRKLYGESITICPVYFKKEWLLWRDTDLGGGFGGAYPTEEQAQAALDGQEKPEEWEVVDTNQHFVLVVNDDGTIEEAVVSMAKSKAKISRILNSLIRINGGPRFSRVYTLTGVPEKNKAGQDFYSLKVSNKGFVNEAIFRHAESVYSLVGSGGVTIDRSVDNDYETDQSDM